MAGSTNLYDTWRTGTTTPVIRTPSPIRPVSTRLGSTLASNASTLIATLAAKRAAEAALVRARLRSTQPGSAAPRTGVGTLAASGGASAAGQGYGGTASSGWGTTTDGGGSAYSGGAAIDPVTGMPTGAGAIDPVTGAPVVGGATGGQTGSNAAAAASGGMTGGAKTAFGKKFTTDSADMMRQNPDAMIAAYYDHAKLGLNTGEYAMSKNQNAARLSLLYTMFRNQSKDPNSDSGFGNYADWTGGYLQNARTPGAAYHTTGDIVNRMMTTDKNDPWYNMLNDPALTPADQGDRFIDAYLAANSGTSDDHILAANRARLTQLQNEFIIQKSQGKATNMTFQDWIKQNGFV